MVFGMVEGGFKQVWQVMLKVGRCLKLKLPKLLKKVIRLQSKNV